jgi:hypothetical protein
MCFTILRRGLSLPTSLSISSFARCHLLLFPLATSDQHRPCFRCVSASFFYAYGVYLHSGFELPSLSAHNKIGMNTAYHHYLHHAKSIRNKPYHTGFMFQIWDIAYGSLYDGECLCVECARKAGLRTRAHYEALDAPNYSIMLQPSFWFETFKKDSQYSEKLAQLAK